MTIESQIDKVPFPISMAEKGEPAVLIRPEQADKAQGKNVIIGEPRVAPNVEKILGHKVVLEKDDDKNKLKIIARLTKHLSKQRLYEMVAAHQRLARLTPLVGQANSTSFAAN